MCDGLSRTRGYTHALAEGADSLCASRPGVDVAAPRLVLLGALVIRTVRTFALAAVVVLALTGCTQSNASGAYTPGDGADADSDQIGLRNVLIIGDGGNYSAIAGTVINKTDVADALTSVSVKPTGLQPVPFTKGRIELRPRGAVFIGAPNTTSPRREAIRLSQVAKPGNIVTLVFSFAKSGDLTVETPIVPAVGPYVDTLAQATPKPTVS